MLTKIPTGFIRHFGAILSLPKECVVCGDNASNEFKISRLYDPGIGTWLMGLKLTYRIVPVYAPVYKKHFIELMVLKYLFWILLVGIIVGAGLGTVIHFIVIAAFPFVAVKYFLTKSSVSIYDATNLNGVTEVILSIMRKDYYDKVSNLGGFDPIPFPEPTIHLLIKKLLLMALLFFPWVYFVVFTT
ncbi:MAG: hypothetical protein KAI86_09650 [Desulfobacterales bacterium]|nr:hypothetical protein [Desulfobacterales bacterium]